MNEHGPQPDRQELPLEVEQQIDRVSDEFETAWRNRGSPRIEQYLERTSIFHRQRLLRELLQVELELRGTRNDIPSAAEYEARFPEYRETILQVFQGFETVAKPTSTITQSEQVVHEHAKGAADADVVIPNATSQKRHATTSQGEFLDALRKHNAPISQATEDQIVALLNLRYQIIQQIGHGGMGLVFRGRHRTLGMDVAIKVLKQGASAERFLREATLLARIKSPHVVRVHDFEVIGGNIPLLVMEWVEGTDLQKTMRDFGGRVDEKYVIPWMRQVCIGMMAAFSEGIIHRDLKPSNILIDGRSQARVADFGLARNCAIADDLSMTGHVMGTPFYMAPEQAEDPRGVDTRADIYSFGATFYHVLTGTPPFAGATSFAIMFKHKSEPLISPISRFPAISERSNEILERCLAKSPSDRFQSFASLLRQLEIAGEGVSPWDALEDDPELQFYLEQYRSRRSRHLRLELDEGYDFPSGRRLRVIRGNLVHQAADAIVSSDDSHLSMGGGVSAAILAAAGPEIELEVRKFIPARPGRAVVTSAGRLNARFIFHGISMSGERSPSRDLISEVMASCFYHADTLDVKTLAFPLLGTGLGRFSRDVCLDTMFRFAARTLLRGSTGVREVSIVLWTNSHRIMESVSIEEAARYRPCLSDYDFAEFFERRIPSSGDFFGYVKRSDGQVGVFVGDNLQGRLDLISSVRFHLQVGTSLSEAVMKLNREICAKELDVFLSSLLLLIDPRTHSVTQANAGHLPTVMRRATGSVEEPGGGLSGIPLGMTDVEYEQTTYQLEPGDVIVMYTDGLVEAVNQAGSYYTISRLRQTIELAGPSAREVGEAVVNDLKRFAPGPPDQDWSLIVFGRKGDT